MDLNGFLCSKTAFPPVKQKDTSVSPEETPHLSRSDGRRPSHLTEGTVSWWASKDID